MRIGAALPAMGGAGVLVLLEHITALGCPVAEPGHPGIPGPMRVVRFPGGGNLSIEFTADARTPASPGWVPGLRCGPGTRRP